jgi:hypothetical protein
MTGHIPEIRVYARNGRIVIREGLSACFYMKQSHATVTQDILRALDIFQDALGNQKLELRLDDEGEWQTLDEAGWRHARHAILEEQRPRIVLWGSDNEKKFQFEYHGRIPDTPFFPGRSREVCALGVWWPTESLKEDGPERFRELASRLAKTLPFCSGHAGLSFQCSTSLVGIRQKLGEYCFRHPGMDVHELENLSWQLGTRLRGPAWMTFVGPPVLSELGGAEGLRARLSSPETTVQALDAERAVVTLGPWPDAGDTEQGRTLPAYRELARVLEPWLYREEVGFPLREVPEQTYRWDRRFLD